MADLKITQLPEETGTVASTFPLAIVNVTAAETRKITTANLATAIFSNLSAGGLAASKVAAGYSGASLTDGTVTNAKLVNSSINFGGVSVALGAQDLTPAFNLTDATNYPASSLTGTITNAQLAGSIAVSKLASSSVSFGGISVSLGSADATPAFDLTDATNYKTTNLVGTITNAQLAGSIDVSKLVGSNVSFGGVTVALGASDTTPAFDLQDATGYKTTNLVGTITNAQLAGSIDASKLVADSLTSTQLGANCVGASELANNAVDSGAVQTGAITNDKVETSSSSSTGLDGATKLRAGSVPANKLDASTIGNGLAINSNVLSINNTITGATSLGLTFSNQGICTGIAALQASDLSGVLATASAVGVVKVPSSGGLSVSGSGDLSLASTVTAHTTRGIAVNAFGQVTSVSASVPSASLPVASTTAIGAIKVPSTSSPLTVDGNGVLTIGVSGVTAGTGFTKFNVNDKGLVTSAGAITAAEIPNISAALLTSGSLDVARIANDSIGREKFSNNSTCIFGSVAQTGFPSITDSYRGELFFDTTEEDLYINDSNAWQPVTTLTKGSLKLGGVYSAATSAVTSVTSHGSSVGLTVGQNLPTPSSTTDSTYLIVGAGGTPSGIPNGPTGELIPPDYLLSVTSSTGSSWVEIDLSTTVSSPTAANVSVVSGYGGSSTNVQTALAEVYSDFLKLGGGNITGELKIESSGSFAFEGTANDYETRLTVVDPGSADRLITFPDATGTVVLQGQTSVVTSTMVDASLANANIAANAAIALSKLAAVSAGQILVGASGTGAITAVTPTGDISLSSAGAFSYVAGSISNADINASAGISASKIDAASTSQAGCVQLSSATTSTSATKAATPAAVKIAKDAADAAQTTATAALPKSGGALTGNLTLNAQTLVRFADSDSSNFIALKAPATIASDITLTLPSAAPAANQILKANASTPTTLEWSADTSATALQLTGGTLSGALNMGANNITNGGTITGTFVGDVTGDISGTSGGFTAGNASNLDSGTVATARLGSGTASSSNFLRGDNTWQAIDLTALSASNLTSGTVPDARFPSTLPAISGANLTTLNASNISSGTIAAARVPTLNQNTTGTAASVTGAAQSAITSLGTLTGLTVNGDLTLTGANYNVVWDKSTDDLIFEDSARAIFGTSSDGLEIFHESDNSYISDTGTGGLVLLSNGTLIETKFGTEHAIKCTKDGSVELYHNGTKKFETGAQTQLMYGNLELTDGWSLYIDNGFNNATSQVQNVGANGSSDLRFKTTPNGGSLTTALTLDSSQNATFAGSLTVDTNTLHVDATNNRVGIGTTSLGSYNSSGDNLVIRSSGTTGLTLSGGATDNCNIFFGNAEDTHVSAQINYDNDTNLLKLAAGESNGVISFCTVSSNERFRIGSAGQLGIAGANYGSDGQVLTSKGGSAAPEWADAGGGGGTVEGTASGAIAANKPCIVHTDGTFKQVVATVTPQTPAGVASTGASAIDGQAINSSTAQTGMAIAHDPVNDNFGILYRTSSNIYFRMAKRTTAGAVDLTINGTGGSFNVQSGHTPTMCFDSTKEQFVVFNTLQTDSTQVAKGYGYTNSSKNVIEQKWSLTIRGNQCQTPHIIFHPGINKPILVFRDYYDSKAYATIITIASDGNSATGSSACELSGSSTNTVYMREVAGILYDPDRTDKLYIGTMMDHTDAMKCVTLTVASTSLTRAGDDEVVSGGSSDKVSQKIAGFVHDSNTGKDILLYKQNSDGLFYGKVVTTSDTGVSVSSKTALTSGSDSIGSATAVYDETLDKIVVIFQDEGDSNKVKAFAIDTSSTNPSAGTISSTLTNGNTDVGANNFVSDAVYDSKTKNVVWTGVDEGNNTWPRWWNLKSATQATNLTTENFIGFADAAYSNSATATVNVVGNTTTQSSLTPGQKYYVTGTGALSTAADTPSVEAGLALSSTKLLIK